jgi:hypothetical protein
MKPFIAIVQHLQEFIKSIWHPSIFGKIEKNVFQQFGINLANFNNLANLPLHAHICALSVSTHSLVHPALCAYLRGVLRFLAGLFVRLAGLFLFY